MLVLPVYDLLLLPGVTFYFKKDILDRMQVEKVEKGEEILFLIQKSEKRREDLTVDDFQNKGLVGTVENIDDDGNLSIRIHDRVEISDVELQNGEFMADAAICSECTDLPEEEEKAIYKETKDSLVQFVNGFPWGVWARAFIQHWNTMTEIVCAISGYLNLSAEEKYEIMETDSERERVGLMQKAVYEFIEMAHVSNEAESAQKETHERVYRESALKKQIDFLQQQLDEMHPENISDVRKFEKKIEESGMNEEALREAQKVLNRMKQEGKDSHEYGLLYDYLDFMTSLYWKKAAPEEIDLNKAEQILDEQHYGLKKVKERIVEQIAVMALNKKQSGSILLFVGAPGTGKTSICQSIAKALNREYVRISLGGVRDEAEIRGHRKTYVGAMPGRITVALKEAGVSNPLMLLDEIDKTSSDYKGDTSAALLEVLDPEQNSKFNDHYVEIPQDLSEVLFIATANDVQGIPRPLLDRMELMEIPGYTENEKEHIAREHLIPKQMEINGIPEGKLVIQPAALGKLINNYTKEAGVRSLERSIGRICRKTARAIMEEGKDKVVVTSRNISRFLGKERYNYLMANEKDEIGIARGLAWTQVGGDTLQIEVNIMPGKGELLLTGQLGDVMKESAQAGISYIRSVSDQYEIDPEFFQKHDMHVHIPEGAVPKDGPSAGITMATAMLSAIIEKPVRADLAMTGEITLRGRVLPIGGLKEKLLAAKYARIKEVLVPEKNRPDIEEMDREIIQGLNIRFVDNMKEVLGEALA